MRWTIGYTFLLLFVSNVAGAATFADLTATHATTGGPTEVHGPLAVLGLGDALAHTETRLTSFSLKAEAVDVQIDHRDTNQTVASVGVSPGYWSDEFHLAQPEFTVVAQGPRPDLFAMPLGHGVNATILGSSATVEFPTASSHSQKLYLQPSGREALKATTARTMTWGGSDARITVHGDFVVAIWDIDLLDSQSGTAVETGVKTKSIAGDPTGTVSGVEEWHEAQAYLTVTRGTMELRLDHLGLGQVFLANSDVNADVVTIYEAEGTLTVPTEAITIDGRTVTLRSEVLLSIAAETDQRLRFTAANAPGSAAIDSVPVSMAASPSGGLQASVWLWVASFAFLTLGILGTRTRRWWQLRSLERAEAAMERGDYEAVARIPTSLLRSPRHAPDAAVLRVAAALRLGNLREAEAFIDHWPKRAYTWDRDFLLAHLHALRGQVALARRALEACLAQAPNMKGAALENPVLAPLIKSASPPVREGYS